MAQGESGQLMSPFKTLSGVQSRLTEAVLGRYKLNHPALTGEIRRMFGSSDVDAGALAQEPIIEAAFPYVTGSETLEQMSGGLLHPSVVGALTSPAADRQYAFPRSMRPYVHQVESWRLLRESTPQSVLVTSGTGSGKTECFMVPLLDDLAREAAVSGRLMGVRAIALYPLNALISSQEERLREWTAPFKGKIRFGLYNGLMPDDQRSASQKPEQVEDRRTLRADPPPILVTNITMLEYMTVRRQDRPLIEASSGKLRWIILDEAHSYVGSRAAEVALLIRRVMLAFDVKPSDVRFVATSATIGEGGDVEAKLKAFLRDVAGVPDARVHVVVGQRRRPVLPTPGPARALSKAELSELGKVASNPIVQNLMRLFDQSAVKWSQISSEAQKLGVDGEALVQALATTGKAAEPLLPVRVHGFVRGVQGVYSCTNPNCSRTPAGWPFGAVLPEAVQRCPHCRSAVLEIEHCSECGEPFLYGVERQGRLSIDVRLMDQDEFAADSEREGEAEDEEESAEEALEQAPDIKRRFSVRDLAAGHILHLDHASGEIRDTAGESTIGLQAHDAVKCAACDCEPVSFVKFRSGAPFLVGNAVPVLLDGVAAREGNSDGPIPDGGRQLLSFTDSRQGTARFAALLQNGSERNFVRAAIYHAVQDTLKPQPGVSERIAELDRQIADMQAAVAAHPAIGAVLEGLKAQRQGLVSPSTSGINWATLRDQMSGRPEIDVLMRRVWRFRDERFLNSSRAFTEFLMLRELVRRPVGAIALETLGLACLRYPVIEQLPSTRLPQAFAARGLSMEDYREFLRAVVAITVRANFAVRTDRENIHWFSGQVFQRRLSPPSSDTGMDGATAHERGQWPKPGGRGAVVSLLDRLLKIDRSDARGRAEVADLLKQAWDDLLPLFTQPGAGGYYALDFERVNVAPVRKAFLCPVTRVLTDVCVGGLSPFGFGRKSRFSGDPAEPFDMPVHPNPFLLAEHGGAAVVEQWLENDASVERLRTRGLWTNIHDRLALESPYFRAAEHSAQQPAGRLRAYEREFKAGGINVLNCSTTMEMGVDIGSVSTVMMTNVPPSLANYRQRVGRAGRRGQGFAMALTYVRPTPLDRETFRDPVGYLSRRIEAPKVTLDSKRIVQRHVNALLLAEWFRQAHGEALRTKIGEFFGCSAAIGAKREPDSAARRFQEWVGQTSVVTAMMPQVAILVRGSSLEADAGLFTAAGGAMKTAETAFGAEWEAVQAQAATMDREAAKKSIGFQLKRMCGENLLGELADRGVLPGHGFPTNVVSFINKDQPDKDEDERSEDRFRYRNYPSRNLDIAIRDYAPGAEIVLDGLVYESAGVTLNWKRPAGESEVKEIQSLKWFWECAGCGGADTGVIKRDDCPICGAPLGPEATVRYLRPAGFTVDMKVKPHAEINEVAFIEPEPERVSTRGADWKPFPTAALGRVRSSHDGLVFYSSKGGKRNTGYSVCLECGRAAADHQAVGTPGFVPLDGHSPLRFTRADVDGKCPGNARSFAVLTSLALGHEISTDVVEVQPAGLERERAAWALGSAMREALTRRLGIESSELGIAVTPHSTSVGGRTHSIFLFDRAAGGAGFAPRLLDLFGDVLKDARAILECQQPGCVTCCSSCVLASDLALRADMIDRRLAMEFLDGELSEMGNPEPEDMIADDAMLSMDAADELVAATKSGDCVTLWASADTDPVAIGSTRMRYLIDRLRQAGAKVTVAVETSVMNSLDQSQKLAARDAAVRHEFEIGSGQRPKFANGAFLIAASSAGRVWASCDENAALFGDEWGIGRSAPVVRASATTTAITTISLETLLPASGTRYAEIGRRLDGPSLSFQDRFVGVLRPELEQTGFWRPGKLVGIEYSDRYLNSPLTVMLALKAMSGIASKLASGAKIDLRVSTAPLRLDSDRLPFRLNHDWQGERTRAEIVKLYGERLNVQPFLAVERCPHSRKMKLLFEDGAAIIAFDQGFGFLRTASPTLFDFQTSSVDQERRLAGLNVLLNAEGASFFVVTPGKP